MSTYAFKNYNLLMLGDLNFKVSEPCRCVLSNLNNLRCLVKDATCFNPLSANPTKWSNTLKQTI